MSKEKAGDDYALSRVPSNVRRPMWEVLIIRLGCLACVSQVMLGAALGYGMTFWGAFWATIFGSVILQAVSFAIGAAAAKEGLSTSLLSRWSGFGKAGSSIIGGIIAISLMGWFGIQNSVFAEGIYKATGIFNMQIWSAITGLVVTIIVVYGYKVLSLTADVTLPLFLCTMVYAGFKLLSGHDIGNLIMTAQPAGKILSMGAATTMVAGGFITGAIITPDLSRYMKGPKDVFAATVVSTFVGELTINLLGVLMALAVRTSDIVSIMLSITGWLGAGIVIFSTLKINDINLYSASLGITNMIDAIFNIKLNRAAATWGIGIFSTILSMLGIINYFQSFLTLLGVTLPPVAGIIFVDYYILKRDRKLLEATRHDENLPESCEIINPIAIAAWIIASIIGKFINIGIPAIMSLLAGAIIYYLVSMLYKAVTKSEKIEFKRTVDI
ncbi:MULTISPECIES: purine-cytosine permease family protein [Clostridium]|uniref:Cytosine permease n=1 Tax=Clostridium coskatii TaxID=1705578 RepID=A0A162KWH8_9CLOT|nr:MULTISPECIES: cytosine permease [Clostridium]OAA87952.1 Cytosine permease [Clostridium coskatii]OBR97587.1 cytosine permease [Clostridium coskatii]QXE18044.1 cytosine permease [Clostridium sp. 001]